jgi:hypothetical protein
MAGYVFGEILMPLAPEHQAQAHDGILRARIINLESLCIIIYLLLSGYIYMYDRIYIGIPTCIIVKIAQCQLYLEVG